jgi:hypothetical protein
LLTDKFDQSAAAIRMGWHPEPPRRMKMTYRCIETTKRTIYCFSRKHALKSASTRMSMTKDSISEKHSVRVPLLPSFRFLKREVLQWILSENTVAWLDLMRTAKQKGIKPSQIDLYQLRVVKEKFAIVVVGTGLCLTDEDGSRRIFDMQAEAERFLYHFCLSGPYNTSDYRVQKIPVSIDEPEVE